jgi:hypothetical protein
MLALYREFVSIVMAYILTGLRFYRHWQLNNALAQVLDLMCFDHF